MRLGSVAVGSAKNLNDVHGGQSVDHQQMNQRVSKVMRINRASSRSLSRRHFSSGHRVTDINSDRGITQITVQVVGLPAGLVGLAALAGQIEHTRAQHRLGSHRKPQKDLGHHQNLVH